MRNESKSNANERAAADGCRRVRELYRDPALWVWLVVLLLAMLPVKAAISG